MSWLTRMMPASQVQQPEVSKAIDMQNFHNPYYQHRDYEAETTLRASEVLPITAGAHLVHESSESSTVHSGQEHRSDQEHPNFLHHRITCINENPQDLSTISFEPGPVELPTIVFQPDPVELP